MEASKSEYLNTSSRLLTRFRLIVGRAEGEPDNRAKPLMKEKGMGLDMYLTGRKYHFNDWQNPDNNQYEDGFRLQSRTFDLGYWRKHPDLHGFIVQNFADGIDDCKPVYLAAESIEQILVAIRDDRLPPTTGFFFGQSTNDDDEKTEAIEILAKALQWLQAEEGVRSVYYQASW